MQLEYVAEWFRFANTDLLISEHLRSMHPVPLEAICYHCQQSAEKFLKGYMVYNGTDVPPKIHDLIVLKVECEKHDNRFNEISQACNILTRYGVQPRYPDEIEVTENDMEKALEYARQICDFKPIKELREIIEQNDDPDFTKVTLSEAASIEAGLGEIARGDFINHDDIKWE